MKHTTHSHAPLCVCVCVSRPLPLQVHVLSQAASLVADADGISAEVVDLRSLLPWDAATVCGSVARTGRLLVSHEAPLTGGFGAELAAEVTRRCFLHLEAPPARVRGGGAGGLVGGGVTGRSTRELGGGIIVCCSSCS